MISGGLYHLVTTCLVSCLFFLLNLFIVVLLFYNNGLLKSTTSNLDFSGLKPLSTFINASNIFAGDSSLALLSFYFRFKHGRTTLSAIFFGVIVLKLLDSSELFKVWNSAFASSIASSISLAFATFVKLRLSPKSQIYIVQSSLTKIFSGFKSRWHIWAECKYLSPHKIS